MDSDNAYDFNKWYSCQVDRNSVFLAFHGLTRCRMLTKSAPNSIFSCLEVSPLSKKELLAHSMCVVNAKFIYITGGYCANWHSVSNCHRYDIDRNLWQEMQEMN